MRSFLGDLAPFGYVMHVSVPVNVSLSIFANSARARRASCVGTSILSSSQQFADE